MLYVFDDYKLDTQTRELRRAGVPIALAAKTYAVLAYLLQHRDRVVSKEELLEQVWPETYIDDSAVRRNIMAVRRAIADRTDAPQRIKSLRGQGYRFIAAVSAYDHPPLPATVPTGEPRAHSPEMQTAAAPALLPPPQPSGVETTQSEPAEPQPLAQTGTRGCAVCQQTNSLAARFCLACGVPLRTICSQCAQEVSLPAAFCPACGQRLPLASAAEPLSPSPTPLAPPPIPRQPSGHSRPVGERKLLTVLCCTVSNAALLVERLGLDAMHRLMQAVYELAGSEMQRFAGTMQSITGESFQVLFGVPRAQEDHARRAVLAALGLQRRWRQSQPDLEVLPGADLALGLGLHTGLAVVGPMRPDQPGTPPIVGDVTTLAAALARQATSGTILASAATLRLLQGEVRTAPVPPLHVAEQLAPVPVHQILELVPRRQHLRAPAARRRSPFVGREAELALLHTRLLRAEQGQGQVVSITGESGMGKSRLLDEFRDRIRARQVTYWQGHCRSYGSAIPYLPVLYMLRAFWGLSEEDGAEAISAKVRAGLQAVDLDTEAWAPYFLHLLGVETELGKAAESSPEVLKARTFEALHQLYLRRDAPRPCILEVEDLHWIDATSEAYVGDLVERLAGAPLLLLVSFRPGYQPAWLHKSYVTQIALQTLEAADSRQVVDAIPGPVRLTDALAQQLLAKAEGNPFFLEELAHTVMEQGRHEAELSVPDTIQAVLAERIDRLPPTEKGLLQAAAVVGSDVSFSLLHAITGLSEGALQQGLEHLRGLEFLYETHLFPEPVYTFKHTLTHEVAYGGLLQEQRRSLHRQIVAALETRYAERVADQVDRLASHALRGELWDKVCLYCRQAGAKAMARSAHWEAVQCYEQALQGLQHLPESRERQEQAIDLRLEVHTALLRLGQSAPAFTILGEAAPMAEALDDALRLGWISSLMSTHRFMMGEPDRAIACAQRALALATVCEDVTLRVDAQLHLGQAYHAVGDYRQAIAGLKQNVVCLDDILRQDQVEAVTPFGIHSLPWLIMCLAETGAFSEAMTYAEQALRIAAAGEVPYELVAVYGAVGVLHVRQGELHQARAMLERGLSLCQSAGIPHLFPTLAAHLGAVYALSGRLAEALPLLEQAVTQGAAMRLMVYHGLAVVALSQAYLLAGRTDEARAQAWRALELCQTHQERGHQAWALQLLGDIAAHRDPPEIESAEAFYQQALSRANELGMHPLLAHCHLGLGTLYSHVEGRGEPARLELSAAIALFRALPMPFWLPPAEAVLAQVAEI